jgi:hypothetical protein
LLAANVQKTNTHENNRSSAFPRSNPEVAVLQDIERTANYAVVRRQTA